MARLVTAVRIPSTGVELDADLHVPEPAGGLVLFAHGAGSGRHSPRNRMVARRLQREGLATLLLDLFTEREEAIDRVTGTLRFDIDLLASRLLDATRWARGARPTRRLPQGYFGASTGAAAAFVAAAARPEIRAVVSRGGRPDLAAEALPRVHCPTLLIVGRLDQLVLSLNQAALARLGAAVKRLEVVEGASHLFEEPGTLAIVADLAAAWFREYLAPRP